MKGKCQCPSFLLYVVLVYLLQVLLARATADQRKSLTSGFDMLTEPEKMGQRFKFCAMLHPDTETDYVPAGFE